MQNIIIIIYTHILKYNIHRNNGTSISQDSIDLLKPYQIPVMHTYQLQKLGTYYFFLRKFDYIDEFLPTPLKVGTYFIGL